MFSAVLNSLLGHGSQGPLMPGMLVRGARVLAWQHRHALVRLEHFVSVLVDLVDVQKALETRGVNVADVQAVMAQLLDDQPRWGADAPDVEPQFDPSLDPLMAGARLNGVLSTARFVDGIATALPPELGFLRGPLAASAAELGATFDATIASTKESVLTFEAWDPELKKCMGLMQHLTDKEFTTSWEMGPVQLFGTLLGYKPYFTRFKGRGVDPLMVLRELGESRLAPTWPVRDRPVGLVATVGPALLALVVRAERYAADDASNVRLRDLLLALHDEPLLARSVDQLVG